MNAAVMELPLRLLPWPPALSTTLARCLLLALLLHLWLLLMLGNAPGGSAAPGQGVGGALNITLRGPVAEGAAPTRAAAEARPTPGPAPESAVPRWGGSVRTAAPAPQELPGAAQLGTPDPAAAATLPSPAAVPAPAPALEPGRVQQERAPDALPTMAPMPTLQPLAAAPPLPRAAPAPPPEPAATEGRLLAPAPGAPLNPALARPLERAPTAAALPTLPSLDGPTATVAEPAPARALVSPVLQGPRAAPVPSLATTPRPGSAEALPRVQPLPSTLPAAAAPQADASPADAGARIGHDVATPGAAASAPRPLNLELARPRGGELSRHSTTGVLPVLPRLPDNDKLAKDIDKSGKADCRSAYSGAGPLAVVPLAIDALKKEGGCKW